jgi:hypothetical protein
MSGLESTIKGMTSERCDGTFGRFVEVDSEVLFVVKEWKSGRESKGWMFGVCCAVGHVRVEVPYLNREAESSNLTAFPLITIGRGGTGTRPTQRLESFAKAIVAFEHLLRI